MYLHVTKDMRQPIFVYYQLDNLYQNHRRYDLLFIASQKGGLDKFVGPNKNYACNNQENLGEIYNNANGHESLGDGAAAASGHENLDENSMLPRG